MALVFGLTVAGFIVTGALAERDARHGSEQRVAIAAAQIRSRVEAATSMTESLRRFMSDEGATDVTNDQFTRNVLRWLSPADLPAAAWAEEVRAADRAAYERRIGQPIVSPDERRKAVPPGSSYLPATLVSGFPPMNSRGIDLRREVGIAAALGRAIRPGGVGATPFADRRDGTRGLFLVAPAPNLIDGVLRPGAVVVFLSEDTLRAAARNPAGLRFSPAGRSSGGRAGGDTVREEFTVAGQQFAVVMPKESVSGPGAVLPWIILAGGLLLAALAGALGVIAARRARAQQDFDRIFNLSPDLVTVANFDGHFTRVNPAAEQILGYTEEELLTRPYLDLVHPDDRERTAAEAAAIGEGKSSLSFENRYARKDGSYRVLEWTSTPVVEERATYAVARDVTERREAEAEVERLADEQAALRRVATVVARGGSRVEVFGAIAEEVRQLFGDSLIYMFRYEDERAVVAVASAGFVKDVFPVGSRHELGGNNAATHVLRTGEPVRIDDYATASGPIAEAVRLTNTRSVVGTPIVADERLWGVMVVATTDDDPLPPETESRLGQFTELMATAIANAESRAEVGQLASDQAALRRVATLVATESPPEEVFAKVVEELANVVGDVDTFLFRLEADGTASAVAICGEKIAAGVPIGTRLPTDGDGAIASVLRAGRPCRIVDTSAATGAIAERGRQLGVRSAVGCPVMVRGRIWGAIGAARYEAEALPAETERRVAQFAELVATAIANADARAQVERLAEEQAALRRVATLVAQGGSPTAVFDAVAVEMETLLAADGVTLSRYESDWEVTVVAHSGINAAKAPPGTRVSHEGENVTSIVRRTERAARIEHCQGAQGPIAELVEDLGVRSSVAAPIIVEGRLWGVTIAIWQGEVSPPPETEARMAQFAELLDTAIANADSRDQLTASRARLVTAADEARRRVVRDLHDGAQQRLVHTIVTLQLAQRALQEENGKAGSLLGEALGHAQQSNAELRELAHGILPAVLTRGGLPAGVGAFVARLDLPVRVDVRAERLPAEIEASAYFVVAEALTNVVKHSHAKGAKVTASVEDGTLHVAVLDDGIGGADPYGHGLVGMADRVSALGGRLRVDSPDGGGTLVAATLPVSEG